MRRRRHVLQVNTFPFLAVLLCAMGSLILLLLVIDRRAKVVARAKVQQAMTQRQAEEDKARQAAEAVRREWELRRQALRASLTQQRQEAEDQVQSVRDKVGAATGAVQQERARYRDLQEQLRAQLARLADEEKDLTVRRVALTQADNQGKATQTELGRLSADLGMLEQTLAHLKLLRQRDQHTYSLVPYRGKQGESRRPLYVECAANGLIFHPDKRTLQGLFVLAQDIRDEVEQRVAKQRADVSANGAKGDDKPYLLFLVRPDGIKHYYDTVAALQGLTMDFGYEFVNADWVLDFADGKDKPNAPPWVATGNIAAPAPATVAGQAPEPRLFVSGQPSGRPEGVRLGGGGSSTGSGRPGGGDGPSVGSGLSGGSASREGNGIFDQGPPFGRAVGSNAPGSGTLEGSAFGGPSPEYGTGEPGGLLGRPSPEAGRGPQTPGPQRIIASSPFGTALGQGLPNAGRPAQTAGSPDGSSPSGSPTTGAAQGTNPSSGSNAQGSSSPGGPSGPSQGSGERGPDGPSLPGATATRVDQGTKPSGGSAAEGSSSGEQTDKPETGSQRTTVEPGQGNANDGGTTSLNPLAPLLPQVPEKKPNQPPRPPQRYGNRDWVIPVECKADTLVLYPSLQKFATAELPTARVADNALLQAVQQLIARRQASVRPGEPLYRPHIRLLVRPDGLRAYFQAYPLLEALRIPMSRQNLDQDEEVYSGGF